MDGLIGRKVGMTQVFDGEGARRAVTVIEVGPCVVLQRKTKAGDGYEAVQIGFGDQKPQRVSKAHAAHCAKAGAPPKRLLREFAVAADEALKPGDTVTAAAVFEGVDYVDVSGVTRGRGFQGVVRRHGMRGGPFTHGGHSKRRIGAIGQRAKPGNIAKNKRMPGHMGHVHVTTQNLRVVGRDWERSLLLVGGAVPGPAGAVVSVSRAVKRPSKAGKAS